MQLEPRMSPARQLLGLRGRRNRPVREILDSATTSVGALLSRVPASHGTLADMKREFVPPARAYYSLAACSRRQGLESQSLAKTLEGLYRFRATLEKAIIAELPLIQRQDTIVSAAFTKRFFGVSAKQGVSIRYPLLTCIPTRLCGGRCYAHDGRDRELHLIFRACLNYYIGDMWEAGDSRQRSRVEKLLDPIVQFGVCEALKEARLASVSGFDRSPRIRFSHIGEMIATPEFSNWLARRIRQIDERVQCIVYTRHIWASRYNPDYFILNFTVDDAGGDRLHYMPSWGRLVSSAWDGRVNPEADVNFLEHHVEKHSRANGLGNICPVTSHRSSASTCDIARCDKCFRNV
jgi:hypothetical protein